MEFSFVTLYIKQEYCARGIILVTVVRLDFSFMPVTHLGSLLDECCRSDSSTSTPHVIAGTITITLSTCYNHFIPLVGVGKRGEYYLGMWRPAKAAPVR